MTVAEVEEVLRSKQSFSDDIRYWVEVRPWKFIVRHDGSRLAVIHQGQIDRLRVFLDCEGVPPAHVIAKTISLWPYYREIAKRKGVLCLEVWPAPSVVPRHVL